MELLKQEVTKIPVTPKKAMAPFLNPKAVANDQPVTEGVLELEPIQVTKKKMIELPLRTAPVTLDDFFYGDGAIFKTANGNFVTSASPYGKNGLAAIKFTLKFRASTTVPELRGTGPIRDKILPRESDAAVFPEYTFPVMRSRPS